MFLYVRMSFTLCHMHPIQSKLWILHVNCWWWKEKPFWFFITESNINARMMRGGTLLISVLWLKVKFTRIRQTIQRKAWHPLARGIDLDRVIINNLYVKFENDWTQTEICIVSTRSYTQSANVDLDLWPLAKPIGFLLLSSTTNM